ncbi:MAG: DUF3137 domain-containing protein [Candidatus Pedobacter colombiensis]|uniref:DUF3137 domain-containing protein n=1 Tax=Candidatus Pedobacter colombiensis TaxID=3121371 RepID=A0AAJ5W7C2_9SPHI|nr:DUF3137 domain-containing protein [Pedobacter sp.]WEK19461.1 MAG: DUF3137 domain-containing protein [Pedobacter sp.]
MDIDILNQQTLQSTLADLENQRKEVSALKVKSYLCIGLGVLTIIGGITSSVFSVAGLTIGTIMLITGFVLISKTNTKFYQYRHNFKQGVIPLVLKTIDESLEMNYRSGLSENEFIYSQLFSKEPDRYRSEDQISGRAGKTAFSFSELHAEYKTVTQTKNGRQEHWHTILKGIVFYADFNKNFNGVTVVRPKDMGTALGAWISKAMPIFNSSDKTLVQLENPEFESEFVTYSTDQVEARYILTPALMQRLCELNNRCSYTISLSFIGSCVFIAFPLNKDYFEPPVHKSLLTSNSLNEDTEVIRFMYGIIKDLDLNTRIWTKR